MDLEDGTEFGLKNQCMRLVERLLQIRDRKIEN